MRNKIPQKYNNSHCKRLFSLTNYQQIINSQRTAMVKDHLGRNPAWKV